MANSVQSCEVIAWPDLGCEAVRRLVVRDFPLTVLLDAHGAISTRAALPPTLPLGRAAHEPPADEMSCPLRAGAGGLHRHRCGAGSLQEPAEGAEAAAAAASQAAASEAAQKQPRRRQPALPARPQAPQRWSVWQRRQPPQSGRSRSMPRRPLKRSSACTPPSVWIPTACSWKPSFRRKKSPPR